MTICPFLKNKKVKQEFGEIEKAVGKTAAYDIWDKNKGYGIRYAPNGKESKLFKRLLDSGKTEDQAIFTKSKFYSMEYLDMYGDWINNPHAYSGKLDENGEPFVDVVDNSRRIANQVGYLIDDNDTTDSESLARQLYHSHTLDYYFGIELSNTLRSGKRVSSKDLMNSLSKSLFVHENDILFHTLERHDVPVILSNDMRGGDLAQTVFDGNGGSFIQLNSKVIESISGEYLKLILQHELVHSLTGNLFHKKQLADQERRLFQSIKTVYDIFDKLFPLTKFSRTDYLNGYYALSNLQEFVAVFATDANVRNLFYQKARQNSKSGIINKLKNLVNRITKFLINKNVFQSTSDRMQAMQNELNSYLLGVSEIRRGNLSDPTILDRLYNEIDNSVLSDDYRAEQSRRFGKYIDQLEKLNISWNSSNPARAVHLHDEIKAQGKTIDDLKKIQSTQLREIMIQFLTSRLAAVKNLYMPEDEKISLSTKITADIQRFELTSNRLYDVVGDFMSAALEDVKKDFEYLRSLQSEDGVWSHLSPDEYMRIKHTNVGVYHKMFSTIASALNSYAIQKQLMQELNTKFNEESKAIDAFEELQNIAQTGASLAKESDDFLKSILCKSVSKQVIDNANKTHDISVAELIDDIENNSLQFDQNKLFTSLWSLDASNDPVLQTINNLVTEALTKADDQTYTQIKKFVKLVKRLSSPSDIQKLYEKLDNGNATQYLIRRLNFGKMLDEYKSFIKKLNVKYKLDKDSRGGPSDENENRKYNEELERWLSENVERPYLPSYYAAYNKLSKLTRKLRGDILIEMSALGRKAVDPDRYGDEYMHFELLTDEELQRYNELQMNLRVLKSDYNINGDLKEGEELKIAKELQQLDDDLYGDSEIEYDYEAWEKARNRVIEECGGIDAMRSGDKTLFNFKKLKAWDAINTVEELIQDEDGNIKLFEYIDNLVDYDYSIVYEINNDGGAAYENLRQQRNEIVKHYRNKQTGDVDVTQMSKKIKTKLVKIEKQMSKIKKSAKNRNKALKQAAAQKAKLLKEYVTWEKNPFYEQQMQKYRRAGKLEEFLHATGIGDPESVDFPWRPFSFLTKMVVKPAYKEQFARMRPANGFAKKGKNSHVNPNYDATFGEYMVPKNIAKYQNKQFDQAFKNNKALRDLYDECLNVTQSIIEKYGLQTMSKYQLPSITGGMITYLRGSGDKVDKLLSYISESYGVSGSGLNDSNRSNAELQHDESAELLEDVDELGEVISPARVVGRMPDGRELRMIPRHYVRKLEMSNAISRDLIYILSESLKQANRFEEKSKIKSSCEMLLDYLGDRTIVKNRGTEREKNVFGKESNAYKAAHSYMDMNLYSIRQKREAKLTFGNKVVDFTKLILKVKNYATLLNLGFKPTIALVGALTAQSAAHIQSIVGYDYSQSEYFAALQEVFLQQMKSYISASDGLASSDSSNKMELLAELFDITNQMERKSKWTNTNRIAKAFRQEGAFSFMTFADFYTKSSIMVAVLKGIRVYNGQLLSKQDVENSQDYYEMNDNERKKLLKDWKKSKQLYDYFVVDKKDGLTIKNEEVRRLFEENFEKIKARVQKLAERADGMPTEQQKSAAAATTIGALVLQHRQFLPLMLQNRFADMTYDRDTQTWQNGLFRTAMNVYGLTFGAISGIQYKGNLKFGFSLPHKEAEKSTYSSMFYATMLGAASGAAFVAPLIGGPLGVITGSALGYLTGKMRGASLNEMFDNTSSHLQFQKSLARRRHVKQIAAEVFMYKLLVQNLAPLLTFLFRLSGGDDKDKDSWYTRMYWLAMYTLHKFSWEMYTPYRFGDLLNNIKSATAATSALDAKDRLVNAGGALLQGIKNTIFPRGTLYDTLKNLTKHDDIGTNETVDPFSDYVNRGAYSHGIPYIMDRPFTKTERDIFKAFPIKNIHEELYGSKEKDNYFKHKIMEEKD